MKNKIYNIIIVGAGPSGLFCASKISDSDSILILDKNDSPAKKLLMSAKGRGNITNININPNTDYITDNQKFVVNSFEQYGVNEFIGFLNKEGIDIKEENNGRILLKSNKVSEFHQKLIQIVVNKGIKIEYNVTINNISKAEHSLFKIYTSIGEFKSKKVIIATGGPSFPNLGATGIAIDIAKSFNLNTTTYYPALVGFETNQDFSPLSGSSVIGKLSLFFRKNIIYEEEGPILFTHRGISGPSVFNASLFLRDRTLSDYKIKLKISSHDITKRLVHFLNFNSNNIKGYIISTNIINVRGLEEAKVCGGGVKTNNLNSNFECKQIKGLYFIGECIDVTGKTGGFNLQWCRTSAAICANGINSNLEL